MATGQASFNRTKSLPKRRVGNKRSVYIADSNRACTLTRLRIGNITGPEKINIERETCPKCKNSNIMNMSVHIITECKTLNESRKGPIQQLIRRKMLDGISNINITKRIVADKTEDNMRQLEKIKVILVKLLLVKGHCG